MPLDENDTDLIMKEGVEIRKELFEVQKQLKHSNQLLSLILNELKQINSNTSRPTKFGGLGGGR